MKIVLFACLLAFALPSGGHAQAAKLPKSLSLNTEHFPPHSTVDGTGFQDLLTTEIFRRLGIAVTYNILPSERVLANANAGLDDGILPRVAGLSAQYPNLIQLEEDAVTTDYVAFSGRNDTVITGWESLKPYHVGIITGWKILEKNITGTSSLTKVNTMEQLFSILNAGRVDLVVYSRLAGLQAIKDRDLGEIRALKPPLVSKSQFHYLHKKHQALIGPVSDTLRQIKADGTYQKIYDVAVGSLVADQ